MKIKKFNFNGAKKANKIYLIYDNTNNFNYFTQLFQTNLNLPMNISSNYKNGIKDIFTSNYKFYKIIEKIFNNFDMDKQYKIKHSLQKLYNSLLFVKNPFYSKEEFELMCNSRIYNLNLVIYNNVYKNLRPELFYNIDYIFINCIEILEKVCIKLENYINNKKIYLCAKKILDLGFGVVFNLNKILYKTNVELNEIIYYYK